MTAAFKFTFQFAGGIDFNGNTMKTYNLKEHGSVGEKIKTFGKFIMQLAHEHDCFVDNMNVTAKDYTLTANEITLQYSPEAATEAAAEAAEAADAAAKTAKTFKNPKLREFAEKAEKAKKEKAKMAAEVAEETPKITISQQGVDIKGPIFKLKGQTVTINARSYLKLG